jgi:hypothetical protein
MTLGRHAAAAEAVISRGQRREPMRIPAAGAAQSPAAAGLFAGTVSMRRYSVARSITNTPLGEKWCQQFEQIVGMDVSIRSLEAAERRLKLDRLPTSRQGSVRLIHGHSCGQLDP